MKKHVFVILMLVFAALCAISCSDSQSDCKEFCERMQTCDETSVWSEDLTTRCKQACDQDDTTQADERYGCLQFDECAKFMSCSSVGGPDHMNGGSDGDSEEAEGV